MTDEDIEKIIKRHMFLRINFAGIRADFEEALQKPFVGLTDAEIDKAWRDADCTKPWDFHRIDVSRAIEAKLREKNGGA